MNGRDRRALYSFMVLHSFFDTMKKRLEENNHKTDWRNESFTDLLKRYNKNMDELNVLLKDPDANKFKIKKCAADAANYLMMIAHNASDEPNARKVAALNSLLTVGHSYMNDDIEYILAENTEGNRQILRDGGFIYEEINAASAIDNKFIELSYLAFNCTNANSWKKESGFYRE